MEKLERILRRNTESTKEPRKKGARAVIWSTDKVPGGNLAALKYRFHLKKKREIGQTFSLFNDYRTKWNSLIVKQAKFSLS